MLYALWKALEARHGHLSLMAHCRLACGEKLHMRMRFGKP